MKVIALKSFVAEIGGRTIHAEEGQELEVDRQVYAGIAGLVQEVKAKTIKPAAETAAIEPPENEAMPSPRKHKKP